MIKIADYRIVRVDPQNLAIEQKVTVAKAKNPFGRNGRPDDEAEAERILEEWRNAPEKVEWKHIGWYGNLKQAALRLINILAENELVDGEDENGVEQVVQTLVAIENRMSALVDAHLMTNTEVAEQE